MIPGDYEDIDTILRWKQERDRFAAALRRYGDHDGDCMIRSSAKAPRAEQCDCGWLALLRDLPPG